jgi:hypothetical protein
VTGGLIFGLTTTLNTADCCASLTSISAGRLRGAQVVRTAVDLYGSEGWGSSPSERAQVRALRCLIGFPVNPHLPPQVSALRWIGHGAEP